MLNTITPGIANIIMIIKKKDGTYSVATLLDEADAKFTANIEMATKWLQEHGN